MYPIQCPGGFNVPVRAGKFSVVGVRATVDSTAAASRVILSDDSGITSGGKWGRFLSGATPYDNKGIFCDIKGIANVDANLEVLFPEPIKLRYGSSAVVSDNVVAGSVMLYVR